MSQKRIRNAEGDGSEEDDDDDEDLDGSKAAGLVAMLSNPTPGELMDGFKRMQRCRIALEALDRSGWKRSFFQRRFHDAFMCACARAFFKLDGEGAFQRAYQRILETNGWNNLAQEVLISTPRR